MGAQQWTLNKIGERMVKQIVIGKFGAYLVNDVMKYYLIQWTSDPWTVMDGPVGMEGGVAREEEWVCRGLWLNNGTCAPRWFLVRRKRGGCSLPICFMPKFGPMNTAQRMTYQG